MRKGFRSRIAGAALSCAMLLNLASALPSMQVNAADDHHDDWLHVENGKVVDMQGNEVWMTGVNWFGYNVGSQVFDGVWSANMNECLDLIADHGFNLLRVPMSTQIILQWKNGEPDDMIKINATTNPELVKSFDENGTPIEYMYSFDVWNKAVEWCREKGIKIMMDIHSATTNAAGHNYPLWYDDNYSTDQWLEALEWFADYYKDDDTIIAIDLKNEPHGKPEEGKFAKWDDSKDENNWKYAAERGAMACLKQNPNLLIMVEGTECYPDFARGADWTTPAVDYAHYGEPSKVFGAWWGANLRGVKDCPVDIGEYTKQIVYSPHDYGPGVWAQDWFYLKDDSKTFTRETLLDDYWRDTWAYLVEDNMYPLLMGEWGGFVDEEHDTTGENVHWLQELRDYMIDKHIHHTFWCFNENSSDTGGLVYDNFGKWDDVKYEFVKPALWQTASGKFISLDHQIPIGKNGISLGEYLGNPPSVPDKPAETTEPKPTETTAPTETKAPTETTAPTETKAPTETAAPTETKPAPTETASATAADTSDGNIIYGDVNGSETVDIMDVIVVNKFLVGSTTLNKQQQLAADVDLNGEVNATDSLNILKYAVDIINKLPVK